MNTPLLGKLEKVALREAWLSESGNFTPWLAESGNLALLGNAIGIELECEAQEKYVGPFRADILCKDVQTDHWVLIENQLERTDHSHLGQLLTYAAGLEAVTIVWIAERFTDEHRAALDWLNQHTDEGINFFGLEVELWRIGNSPLAPKFNVVSLPNEWTRSITAAANDSEMSSHRLNYWTAFVREPALKAILTSPLNANRLGHLNLPVGWENCRFAVFMNRTAKQIGLSLTCRGDRGPDNYQELLKQREGIEGVLGMQLQWREGSIETKSSITYRLPKNDVEDPNDWVRQHALLAAKAVEFYRAFDPFIRQFERSSEISD